MPACPFCGVISETPHETEEACIQALHAEIARIREVLGLVGSATRRPDDPEEGVKPGSDRGLTPV